MFEKISASRIWQKKYIYNKSLMKLTRFTVTIKLLIPILQNEPCHAKTFFGVFDQVRHKLACTATEAS